MQTDSQTTAARQAAAKDKQPLNLTKEIKNQAEGASNKQPASVELCRKWGVETVAFKMVHARKF